MRKHNKHETCITSQLKKNREELYPTNKSDLTDRTHFIKKKYKSGRPCFKSSWSESAWSPLLWNIYSWPPYHFSSHSSLLMLPTDCKLCWFWWQLFIQSNHLSCFLHFWDSFFLHFWIKCWILKRKRVLTGLSNYVRDSNLLIHSWEFCWI